MKFVAGFILYIPIIQQSVSGTHFYKERHTDVKLHNDIHNISGSKMKFVAGFILYIPIIHQSVSGTHLYKERHTDVKVHKDLHNISAFKMKFVTGSDSIRFQAQKSPVTLKIQMAKH